MKMTRTFIGLSSAALALVVLIVTVHYVAHARESAPAIHVDTTPVDRTPGSGNSYGPIIKKIAPSVVNIYSTRFIKQRVYRDPFYPLMRQFFGNQIPDESREYTRRDNWLGSGMIVTPDGYILTANHVVDGADEINVTTSNDKIEYPAKIIGTDPATDIAVLKIEGANLPAISLGDSSQLEVGDVVLAIGNPFGVGQTVTRGIISALSRSLPMEDDANPYHSARYQDFIQTDASINQGNSGGALVDAQGRLIGINDAIVSPSGASAGIGFAVPINLARSVMESFLNGGKVARGYLGVDLQEVDAGLAKSFGVSSSGGALVTQVGDGTPAANAGLKSGDVIVAINDQSVSSVENLKVTISQLAPGSKAALKVIRTGAELKLTATLGEKSLGEKPPLQPNPATATPESPRADALDGVYVQDLDSGFRRQLGAPLDVVGAVVTDVDNASNSSVAGLHRGDVILEINHQPVANAGDAVRLGKSVKSDQILVKVWRRFADGAVIRYLSVSNTRHTK
ncbi:MAG: Do family serine endopeptidase [Verrucomicrobiae bacterium]|nr:Do family serine endopeptidase [Verrucomicrobiae bacterium]